MSKILMQAATLQELLLVTARPLTRADLPSECNTQTTLAPRQGSKDCITCGYRRSSYLLFQAGLFILYLL
jgi:hypothetical protein